LWTFGTHLIKLLEPKPEVLHKIMNCPTRVRVPANETSTVWVWSWYHARHLTSRLCYEASIRATSWVVLGMWQKFDEEKSKHALWLSKLSWHNFAQHGTRHTSKSLRSARGDCKTYDLSAGLCFQS
jgi:hypothetical protein